MTITEWLTEYAQSHQNATNKMIHFICVPTIFFTIVGFFYSIKLPPVAGYQITFAHIALLIVAIYYLKLSRPIAFGMILFSIGCLALCSFLEGVLPIALWKFCLILFVVAWIFQFWGHKIEGKKPSFLKDLQFLMIGPAWVISYLYQQLGIKY